MTRRLLNSLLYFPSRSLGATPETIGLDFRELAIDTEDGKRLHGWWIPAAATASGHVLLCHGNAGNVADRLPHAALLAAAGLDVLLFDYRGYGRSSGSPGEEGTYRDARAARACLLRQPRVDAAHVLYLGESLGGAVALELALAFPPAGLILQSAWTSVRDLARLHYPLVPPGLVPNAYPSLDRIPDLAAPLLVLHGAHDDIVPLLHGEALFDAAPEPKWLHVLPGVGHNDLVSGLGPRYGELIATWAGGCFSRERGGDR